MTPESTEDPSRSASSRLEPLLDLSDPVADWAEADLAGMLRHQLAQPIDSAPVTIRQILEQSPPSVESLQAVKRLSKARRARGDGAVPADLWRVIYFAAIAAAVRSNLQISELSSMELRQGFQWALSRPWLGPELRTILESALRAVAS